MDLELGPMPSTREVQEVRWKYGLTRLDTPFGGAADAHQQCVVCIGHVLYWCWAVETFVKLYAEERQNHNARMRSLELPRGRTRFGESLINFDGKFSQPMATVRKLAFFSDTLFGGIVPNELTDHGTCESSCTNSEDRKYHRVCGKGNWCLSTLKFEFH